MLRLGRTTDDFGAEIEAHIELEAERLREQGMSAEEAYRSARRVFGNVTQARERFYEAGRWMWWDALAADTAYAWRMLRHAPGFTTIAVLTMALGIGATTAIFSVVHATLLHPLPYPEPERLVHIQDDLPGVGSRDVGMSTPEWQDLQRSGIFEYVSPAWYDDNNLTGSSAQPMRVSLLTVAGNYFALLGVKPQLGSAFDPDDPTPGFHLKVVISDGLWQRAFGRDPHVLERNVRLDTDVYRVIGVMPPGFCAPGRSVAERNVEVWAAAGFAAPPFAVPPRRSSHFPGAIARVKRGLTLAEAQTRADALVESLQKQYPDSYPRQTAWTIRLIPLKESVVGDVRHSLLLLLGAVALVLLIGCLNIANLLLARASTRGREMAIRQALGAGRSRLTRQLMSESLLLALLGGTAGVAILFWTQGFLLRLVPQSLPRLGDPSINGVALLFALGASLAAGALFGLAPALHARKLDLSHMLKREGRGTRGSGEQTRTRHVLVIAEFAMSLVLMIAASLLLRSFVDLMNVRLGFNPQSVMAVRTRLPYPNDPKADIYGTAAQEAPFLREILRRGKTLPGVEEIAAGTSIPLDRAQQDQNLLPLVREGSGLPVSEAPLVAASIVTPEYSHLMGLTLLRGRWITDFDNEKAQGAAVISEAMAQTYWPNEDPLGKRLSLSRLAPSWMTVVGVVADSRTQSLEDARVPQIYVSLYQRGAKHLAIFLRGHLDASSIPEAVRELVQSLNPELPVFGATTLNDSLSASLSVRRFSMQITVLFALTALLLAGLGIYGVISYLVSERTHEIGLRIALGASREKIMRMVLQQGLRLALCGAVVGLAGAEIVSHLMAGLLFGVKPNDPLTLLGVTAVLTLVALAACYIPARRAVRVDPIAALHCE